MNYLEIPAIAIALYILLHFVSSYFSVITGRRKIRILFMKIFPLIEMTLWLTYIFWAFDQLFYGMVAYLVLTGSLIIVIVFLFGWYFLRDFISGIILKAENAFEPGQPIQIFEVSGTIKKLGYRSMEIVTSEGEHVKIPFNLLASQKLMKPAETGNWLEQVIRIKLTTGYRPEKIQDMLKNRIIEMPWIVSGDYIKIKITRDESGNYMVEIHLRSLNPEMALKTEEILEVFVREAFV